MLWIPGPTEVRPELLRECARPTIGHRSKAMVALIERLDPGLRLAFGLAPDSDAHVAVHSVSATGLMEAALIGVGPRVLCCVNGAFSKRWAQLAEGLGKQVRVLDAEWGAVSPPAELRRVLAEEGPFDALTVVSSETSTGTLTPLGPVAQVLADHPNTMLLVDLVSYIAGGPVDFDANRIGFGFAGIQKAFALPPGISVACASDAYMRGARELKRASYTLDPVRIVEGHTARKTPATPCISLYYALAQQLEDISSGVTLLPGERDLAGAAAWSARFAKHTRMQLQTLAWAQKHGLELLPAAEHASPTVSCIRAGAIDVAAFTAALKERGLEISNGYGQLKGQTFRIGHMGDHTEEQLTELLAAMDEVLATAAS